MAERQLSHEEALRVLHRASRRSTLPLLVGWALAALVLMAVRLWRGGEIVEAVTFALAVCGVLALWQLLTDGRRTRRLAHTRDWQRLERGMISHRAGRTVTITGRTGRPVVADMHSAWSLDESTPVWVGPRIAVGEDIVLVRDSSAAWASPVHASTGPTRAAQS